MLCLEDCIALSSLTEEEVAAIAEHEHLPMMVAAELGNYLVQTPDGSRCIKEMIRDDIRVAHESDNLVHELTLKLVLHHYLACHPETTGTARCSSTGGAETIRRVLERMPPRYA